MTNQDAGLDLETPVAGLSLHLLRKGSGPPAIVLHHDIGTQSWLPFYEALSKTFDTLVPDLPGYGASQRPEWARHPRDLAILMLQLIDDLGLKDLALVGLGFGGWVAAEMATMSQDKLASLVLAAPFGLQPQQGEILDQFMLSHVDYVKAGFRDDDAFDGHFASEPSPEEALCWDLNREMTARIAWKPYMFSHPLPHLLAGVRTRTLVVWGEQDRIIPFECASLYTGALPNAELTILPETGHFIDLERPQELADLVVKHAGA